MEYIARTIKTLLHVERFQEQNEKIFIQLERRYLSHTFDFLLRLLYRCVLCIHLLSCLSIYLLAALCKQVSLNINLLYTGLHWKTVFLLNVIPRLNNYVFNQINKYNYKRRSAKYHQRSNTSNNNNRHPLLWMPKYEEYHFYFQPVSSSEHRPTSSHTNYTQ